jgi:hypothetical protein
MAEAGAAYKSLGDMAARNRCGLGLTVIEHRRRREFGELTVFGLGKRDLVAREQIVGGDYNSAATRLLSRLKRKGWE